MLQLHTDNSDRDYHSRGHTYVSAAALRVLSAVMEEQRAQGRPVTVRQVCRRLGCTPNSVLPQMQLLHSFGLLWRQKGLCATTQSAVRFIPAAELASG